MNSMIEACTKNLEAQMDKHLLKPNEAIVVDGSRQQYFKTINGEIKEAYYCATIDPFNLGFDYLLCEYGLMDGSMNHTYFSHSDFLGSYKDLDLFSGLNFK